MSNYVKATNFASKDGLPVGDANKKVKGTEIDNEFNAISDAIESKADSNSSVFTGTPTAPTAAVGTNTTQLATTAFVNSEISNDAVLPTRSVVSGNGLTGGGDLSSDRTLAVGAGTGITVNADDVAITATGVTADTYGSSTAIPSITVNAQGQITSASETSFTTRTPVITGETAIWDSGSDGYDGSFTKYSFAKSLTNNLDVGYFHLEAWSATAPTGGGTTTVQVSNESDGSPFVEAKADQSGNLGRDDATNTTKSEFYVFINLSEDPSNSSNWAVWIKSSGGGTANYGRVALAGYM